MNDLNTLHWKAISTSNTWWQTGDTFSHSVNALMSNLKFTSQAILTWGIGWLNRAELLARFGHVSTIEALEKIREGNKTFDLFKEATYEAFRLISMWNWKRAISINAYLSDINNPNFFIYINHLQDIFSIDPSLLTFELLEYDHWKIDSNSIMLLRALGLLGYRIAIDDFSLSLDKDNKSQETLDVLFRNDVPISEIKIDWGYLRKITDLAEMTNCNLAKLDELGFAIRNIKSMWVKDIVWEWATNETARTMRDIWCNLYQWLSLDPNTFKIN